MTVTGARVELQCQGLSDAPAAATGATRRWGPEDPTAWLAGLACSVPEVGLEVAGGYVALASPPSGLDDTASFFR